MQEITVGSIVGNKFEIVGKQGKGSLGEDIYLGRHLDLGRDIVIRILPAAMPGDECMKRFLQGIGLAAKLQHPNIVSILDAGEEGGMNFVVTTYEKGFFLNDYLDQRGRLDETESIRLVKGLADALDYAWNELRIIHRNVCPNTILIAKGNVPMLTDFAMAKSLLGDAKLTLAGFSIGDPTYMSPEQARGDKIDFRSDIYCLGLVFYQLLAGYPPFRDKNPTDLMKDQLSTPHRPVQATNEHVSDACAAVVDKMLEKEKNARYQSWDEVVSDIDAILNNTRPSALNKDSRKLIDKVRRETEEKLGKKYRTEMNKVAQELAKDTRRRFRRNIIILTVIANIALVAAFLFYMKWKREQSGSVSSGKNLDAPAGQR
ncbi:MAG: serine/threonine protein kinase [Victivallales bacterium]|nr:serine/threonine protein kinase [Victivallales bacterium]